jgi:putative endonuclease
VSETFRQTRGRQAQVLGLAAEDAACLALEQDGWTIRCRRLRTEAGEIDLVAEKDGLLAIVEVKARPTLADAVGALTPRQQARLLAAAEIVLAAHPEWSTHAVRFDVLVVDKSGAVRRVCNAFRAE